jgi:hypothetical protein
MSDEQYATLALQALPLTSRDWLALQPEELEATLQLLYNSPRTENPAQLWQGMSREQVLANLKGIADVQRRVAASSSAILDASRLST